jgi:hypothetical protein
MDVARFMLDLDTYVARVTEMVEAVFSVNCGCRADCFRIADHPPGIRRFRSCECNGDIPTSMLRWLQEKH